jgi:hypothetical protein
MNSYWVGFTLAAISGLSLSLIGVAFRLGQSRNVLPLHIATSIGIFGALFFGFQMDWGQMGQIPLFIYGLALLNALGQILSMELTKVGLRKGPLSPVWCALNLTFLVVIVYSALCLNEKINVFQYLALLAGILCVIAASHLGQTTTEKGQRLSLKDKVSYGSILVLILLGNSVVFVTIKDLGMRSIPEGGNTYLGAYLPNIYFILYATMAIACGAGAYFQKVKPTSGLALVKLGVMAGIGSIGGLYLLSRCMALPAALVFTINGMVTILGGTLASVLFFGEPRTKAWYATLGFGILAVILANLDQLS